MSNIKVLHEQARTLSFLIQNLKNPISNEKIRNLSQLSDYVLENVQRVRLEIDNDFKEISQIIPVITPNGGYARIFCKGKNCDFEVHLRLNELRDLMDYYKVKGQGNLIGKMIDIRNFKPRNNEKCTCGCGDTWKF